MDNSARSICHRFAISEPSIISSSRPSSMRPCPVSDICLRYFPYWFLRHQTRLSISQNGCCSDIHIDPIFDNINQLWEICSSEILKWLLGVRASLNCQEGKGKMGLAKKPVASSGSWFCGFIDIPGVVGWPGDRGLWFEHLKYRYPCALRCTLLIM